MKKTALLAMICSGLVFTSFAQITKGSVLLGGGISGSNGKSESGTQEA